jgi:methionine-rich copper-binding protein CopC
VLVALLRTLSGALFVAAMTMVAPGAAAHTALTASEPAADTTLAAGPARVSATFNEDLQPTFAAMTVVGPDGNLWSSGDPEVRGAVVSVAVRPLGPAGRYTVNYRVTSADGHVVTGSWSFTVTVLGTGTPGPQPVAVAPGDRIPLWPFIVGATVLVGAAAGWGLRRRS